METLQFTIQINASREAVWEKLWEKANYKIWTAPFCEGSYYEVSDWKQGNKIHLLTPDGSGMYSILETIDEPNVLTFNHLGDIKNFEEQPVASNANAWTNAKESYQLLKVEKGTELIVKVDTIETYIDFMNKTFPVALEALKNLAEN